MEHMSLGMEVQQDKTEDFAEIIPGNHFLESLLTGARGMVVNFEVILCPWKDEMFIVECTPAMSV